MDKVYKLRYQILMEHGDFKKTDAGPEHGLCDKFIFVSILTNPDGSTSTALIGKDATQEPGVLTDTDPIEMFKAWVLLGHNLAKELSPSTWQQVVCSNTFDIVKDILRGKRERGNIKDGGSSGDSQ